MEIIRTCEEKQIQSGTRDYELLEKLVQKYEGEIRNHIRVEKSFF